MSPSSPYTLTVTYTDHRSWDLPDPVPCRKPSLWGWAYLFTIVLANVLTSFFGVLRIGTFPIGPAGTWVVGLSFSFRDKVQEAYGKWGCWGWMGAACVLSVLLGSGRVAIASGAAFLVSETADWAVYSRLGGSFRRRVIISNLIGIPLDSLVFIPLIFGWNGPIILSQAVVKFLASLLVLFWWGRSR